MRTIYKYPLTGPTGSPFSISIPEDWKFLKADVQRGTPCIWVEVESEEKLIHEATFVVVGTGQAVPDGFVHIDTFFDGPFVWHLYTKCLPLEVNSSIDMLEEIIRGLK